MPGESVNLLTLVPTAMATTALILSCIFSFSCRTMKIVQYANASDVLNITGIVGRVNTTSSIVNETILEIGPWAWQTNDIYRVQDQIQVFEVCRLYSVLETTWGIDTDIYDNDPLTQSIRAFTVLIAIFSGIVVMYMCITPCRSISVCRWKIYGVILLCCSVFMGYCLLMPLSGLCTNNEIIQTLELRNNEETANSFPNECVPDVGYRCGIVATALYFLTGIVVILGKPPRKVDDENWCIYEDNSYYMSYDDVENEGPHVEEVKHLMSSSNNSQQPKDDDDDEQQQTQQQQEQQQDSTNVDSSLPSVSMARRKDDVIAESDPETSGIPTSSTAHNTTSTTENTTKRRTKQQPIASVIQSTIVALSIFMVMNNIALIKSFSVDSTNRRSASAFAFHLSKNNNHLRHQYKTTWRLGGNRRIKFYGDENRFETITTSSNPRQLLYSATDSNEEGITSTTTTSVLSTMTKPQQYQASSTPSSLSSKQQQSRTENESLSQNVERGTPYVDRMNDLEGNNDPPKQLQQQQQQQHERRQQNNNLIIGNLVLLTVPLSWGSYAPVVRGLSKLDPPIPGFVFSAAYYCLAAITLTSLVRIIPQRFDNNDLSNDVSESEFPIMGGIELGSYLFLANCLQVVGLQTVESDRAGFLVQLTTVLVPIIEAIVFAIGSSGGGASFWSIVPIQTWFACLLAFTGVIVMGFDGDAAAIALSSSSSSSSSITPQLDQLSVLLNSFSTGDALIVGAAVLYSLHVVRLSGYARSTTPLKLAAAKATTESIFSVLLLVGLMLLSTTATEASLPTAGVDTASLYKFAVETGTDITKFMSSYTSKISTGTVSIDEVLPAIGAVFWTGWVTCSYTIWAQSFGQARVTPSAANLIYTAQPLFTSLFAYFLLGETMGPTGLVGGALIATAVYTVAASSNMDDDDDNIDTTKANTVDNVSASS